MIRIFLSVLTLLVISLHLSAQSSDREIIIIEKTIDEKGNEVSKKIIRREGDDISDEEVEELLEDSGIRFGQFDIEGLGFGPEDFQTWGNWLEPNENASSKPKLGLSLSFEHDRVLVAAVSEGSGAAESDIRKGDEIVSILDTPVSSYQEISDLLSTKSVGDEVIVRIHRDGEEIDKVVKLSADGAFGGFFEMDTGDFGDIMDMMPKMNIEDFKKLFDNMPSDSLFHGFDIQSFPFEQYRLQQMEPGINVGRASLGVYIDDANGDVEISELVSGGAADDAGLREGDVIVDFDDQKITSFRELKMMMNRQKPGDVIQLKYRRGAKEMTTKVTLQ